MVVDEATFGHRQCVRPAFTLDASATIACPWPPRVVVDHVVLDGPG